MREFEISLTKNLSKGLRPFSKNALSTSFLFECHNFCPTETGLVSHETIYSIQWTSGYFNYLQIKDQLGVSWYWYPVFDGHILVSSSIPSEPTTGLDAIAVTPVTIPYWVNIVDENSAIWRLYPDSTTGETRAKDSNPAVGTGMSNLVWRGTTSENWYIKFDDATKTRYAVKI